MEILLKCGSTMLIKGREAVPVSFEVRHDRPCCRATSAYRAQYSDRGQGIQGDGSVPHCEPVWACTGFEYAGIGGVAAQGASACSGNLGRNLAGLCQKPKPDVGVYGPKVADKVNIREKTHEDFPIDRWGSVRHYAGCGTAD